MIAALAWGAVSVASGIGMLMANRAGRETVAVLFFVAMIFAGMGFNETLDRAAEQEAVRAASAHNERAEP